MNTKPIVKVKVPTELTENEKFIAEVSTLIQSYKAEVSISREGVKGAPRQNPEGEIITRFTDTKIKLTHTNARLARKWLRKHSLSVTVAEKKDNIWTFSETPDSVLEAAKPQAKEQPVKA